MVATSRLMLVMVSALNKKGSFLIALVHWGGALMPMIFFKDYRIFIITKLERYLNGFFQK